MRVSVRISEARHRRLLQGPRRQLDPQRMVEAADVGARKRAAQSLTQAAVKSRSSSSSGGESLLGGVSVNHRFDVVDCVVEVG
jgi:hypothetical protein